MDTRLRTPLISFCTVQLWTLCAAHSLATLYLCTTSGPDPGELPGFWGSTVFRHAPIPRKGPGKQQQHQIFRDVCSSLLPTMRSEIFCSFSSLDIVADGCVLVVYHNCVNSSLNIDAIKILLSCFLSCECHSSHPFGISQHALVQRQIP